MNIRNTVSALAPTLLWMGIIFSLSTGAGGATHTNTFLDRFLARWFPVWSRDMTWATRDAIHFYVRKAAHLTEYAILGALMARTVRKMGWVRGSRIMLLAWALSTVYASSDEFHQRFVPGRTPKVEDVMIDSAGAVIGIGFIAVLVKKRNA